MRLILSILFLLPIYLSARDTIPSTYRFYKYDTVVNGNYVRVKITPKKTVYSEGKQLGLFALQNALSFSSGFTYRIRETTIHWPHKIPDNWNQQWWNANISWTNKYVDNNPELGRTNVPVVFTDAYHLFGTIHRVTLFGSGMVVAFGVPRPWWYYLAEIGATMVFFGIGWHFGNYIFK